MLIATEKNTRPNIAMDLLILKGGTTRFGHRKNISCSFAVGQNCCKKKQVIKKGEQNIS
jgi:hypothetical protein